MDFTYEMKEESGVKVILMKGMLMEKLQAEDLLTKVDGAIERQKCDFIVDLAELTQMNSTGLNVLINILTKSRNRGGDVVIINVPEKINRLLLITKLNTVFTVAKNKLLALETFKNTAENL